MRDPRTDPRGGDVLRLRGDTITIHVDAVAAGWVTYRVYAGGFFRTARRKLFEAWTEAALDECEPPEGMAP